jgi:hypothetical protein
MKRYVTALLAVFLVTGKVGTAADASNYELKPIALPGASGAVALDYFAYDPATRKTVGAGEQSWQRSGDR